MKNKYKERYIKRQRERGLCIFCANPVIAGGQCEYHWFYYCAQRNLGDGSLGVEIKDKLISQNFRCYLSGRLLVIGANASIDHIVSRKLKNELKNKLDNVAWCDINVNHAKRHLSREVFVSLCQDVVVNSKSL